MCTNTMLIVCYVGGSVFNVHFQETIRQSKESKLDEAGRMSIKRSLENVNRIIPG